MSLAMIRSFRTALAAAIAVVVLAPTDASANTPDVAADCVGFRFDLPAGIVGTTVVVLVNDRVAFTDIIEVQGESSSFTLRSPDPSVARHYLVDVVAPGDNEDHRFVIDIPPCVIDTTTTTSPSTTTSTTVPPPSSTTAPTSTLPAQAVPSVPSPSSTIVTSSTLRPAASATTTTAPPSVPGELPKTGGPLVLLYAALLALAGGAVCAVIVRRGWAS